MIHRIFAFHDVPSQGVFEHPDVGGVRADVLKFSRSKAVLDTKVYVDKDTVLQVTLELPRGVSLELEATVVDSGKYALFLRWNHADKESEARLASALVDAAIWMLEKVESIALLTGVPGSGFDTPSPRNQARERAPTGGDPDSTDSADSPEVRQLDPEEPRTQLESPPGSRR